MEHPLNLVDLGLRELNRALGSMPQREHVRSESLRERIEHLDLEDDSPAAGRHNQGQPPIQEGDMAERLTNLESQVSQLRVDMAEVRTKVAHIEKSMLTKGMAAMCALGVVMTILGGGWWVVQQYLSPLLKAAGSS